MFHIRQKNSYCSECTLNVARLLNCFNYPTGSPIVVLRGISYINFVSKTLGLPQKVVAVWTDFVQARNVTATCWKPCCNTQTAHLWGQQKWKKLQNYEDISRMKTCPGVPFSVAPLAALSRLRGQNCEQDIRLHPPWNVSLQWGRLFIFFFFYWSIVYVKLLYKLQVYNIVIYNFFKFTPHL